MKHLLKYITYVKILQSGHMEHLLKYIMFYIQKHMIPLVICFNPPLVCDKLLVVPAFVRLIYSNECYKVKIVWSLDVDWEKVHKL